MELTALSTKVCSKCGMVLPLNMFYKNGGGSRRPDCKQCKQKEGFKVYGGANWGALMLNS